MAGITVSSNYNLWVGQILKMARLRLGLTPTQLGVLLGLKSNGRIVRLWENDRREIGGHITTLEKVMDVYELSDEEKQEVVKRVSLRSQEAVAKKVSAQGACSSQADEVNELTLLSQLMALPVKSRQMVIREVLQKSFKQ